ncbi:MAG TPA: hypothetical protein EYG99_01955 [Candidatus Pacebacteria bacterium]|nr:hypothetical protein [Candidatus Paceibacterota bacterium]
MSSQIIDKIKKNKIKPKSRWTFLLRDYFMWLFFGTSIVVGGLAFAVMLFLITSNDWDVYKYLDKSFGEYLLLSIPYFWIGLLTLFLLLAYYNYRHTKKGYRYKAYGIVLASVFLSILIGTVLFNAGLGNKIENIFADNFPYYHNLTRYRAHRAQMWNQPDRGLIAGEIINIKGKNSFMLKDLEGDMWEIEVTDALWKGRAVQEVGEKIKIIGSKKGDVMFSAIEIRPWTGQHNNTQHYGNGKEQGKKQQKWYR